MIHKQCLELVKVLLQSSENVSRFKFFPAPAYRISCFENMQSECKADMKDIMGLIFC